MKGKFYKLWWIVFLPQDDGRPVAKGAISGGEAALPTRKMRSTKEIL